MNPGQANTETEIAYSPLAILNLFNNAVSVPETRRLIRIKGVYFPGKGANYNGYFYDSLRDESSDASMTLIVPGLIRNGLESNRTIVFLGYITRRVVNAGGRIEVQITVSELVEQTANKHTEEEWKALEVVQRKVAAGYRDVTSFLKARIIQEQSVRILVLIGKTGIIDSDIKHQLRESIAAYDIRFERIGLTSEAEILAAVDRHNGESTDVLVIARGGGENLDIFNRATIAERCIGLTPYFLTAIGHKEDNTLLQKVADKAFIVPAEFGQYLNDLYNGTQEELQNSKAKLVEDITKQLKANYEKQLANLNDQVVAQTTLKEKLTADLQKVHTERVDALNGQIEALKRNHADAMVQMRQMQADGLSLLRRQVETLTSETKAKDAQLYSYKNKVREMAARKRSVNWAVVVVALVLGLILGLYLKR